MGYNYFDDDDINASREIAGQKLFNEIRGRINPRSLADDMKDIFDDIIHGRAAREMREMPNLKSVILKLLAFVLFLLFVVIFIFSFSHTIHTQTKKLNQFNADAGKVCTDIISKYGSVKWERLDSDTYGKDKARLIGLSYARQMDFDNDGSAELMVCYNNGSEYMLEVYSYINKKFTKVYSEEANSTKKVKNGSWIGFYHKNNKYYICKSDKSSPEKVTLYALKGDTFKKTSTCDYDYKNDIYSVKGKINADDFETIKLSVIKTSKAEKITDIVTENLETFSSISLTTLENKKSSEQLKMDAYYEIIEKRIEHYGEAEVDSENGRNYISGLAYVDLVDFNNDDNEELVISFRKNLRKSSTDYYTGNFIIVEEPVYCMEIYNWNGSIAKKIYTSDSVSNYLEDDTVNYIMLHKSGELTDLCVNNYSKQTSFTYTASSKIYRLKKGKFDTTYNARMEYDYGYKEYYINNEYTYSSNFEQEGYKVPMFLNDNGSYDSEKYKVVYLSGKKNYNYKNVVDKTTKTIQKINQSYTPKK